MMQKNIYTHITENKVKTMLLMLVFTGVVFALSFFFSNYFHSKSILLWGAFASLFSNAAAFWFSDKIAIASAGARPADESKYKELHQIIENLAMTAGLPKPKVYVIDDPAPNAFATGRSPKHSSVAVTTGLLNMLDKSELEGVLAHELSHIGNRDILLMSVAVVLVGFIAAMVDIGHRMMFFGRGDSDSKSPIAFWVWIITMFLAPIVAQLMQLAISRKREFLADSSGVLLTRYPEGLASALVKIGSYSAPMRRASSATAHLFISNPFGSESKSGKFIARLFSTHPPIEDRVKALLGDKAEEFLEIKYKL